MWDLGKTFSMNLINVIKERLDFFVAQGIKGADAMLSAIGPPLEIFWRYNKSGKITGETVETGESLEKVLEVVGHHNALSTVLLEQELGKVDDPSALHVLWKWNFEQFS